MATLAENREYWEKVHPWEDEGFEWSNAWHHPGVQWFGSILPRIARYLPTGTILEIAPGHGRWTGFLQGYCNHMQAVDLSKKSISYCIDKYRHLKHLRFFVNDGTSLPMIAPTSVDFVFSMDSFVHFDQRTINCYLSEISKKLKAGGVGFIHHSNLGAHCNYIINDGWRSPDVSYKTFEEACNRNNLFCCSQELIGWGSHKHILTDCFSLFTKSERPITNQLIENFLFQDEISMLRDLSELVLSTTSSSL